MPKKRSSVYSKPNNPAHPSLSSSNKNASHSLSTTASTANTVNGRIQQLRLEQNAAGSKPFEAPPPHTVHPSLRAILQVPDAPPPRPRPGLRVTGGRRGPAGPAPPGSWLQRRPAEENGIEDTRPACRTSAALPGYDMPSANSLLDLTLKNLARDFDFHVEYDQYYLATIPVRYKELLLHYIALHNFHSIDCTALKTLFLEETELDEATGASDLIRLDLSTSIGRSLPLKDLKSFFVTPLPPETSKTAAATSSTTVPDNWDAAITLTPSLSLPRFNSITHLSLSHPPRNITWSSFLSLLPHLPQTLTHLAIAFWPFPTLTPNSLTASTTTPTGPIQAGGSHFYSAFDNDWTESASILRRVARLTPGLQWLDLTGDWPWIQALDGEGFDWGVSWAALDTIIIGQGWVPEFFQVEECQSGWREAFALTGAFGEASNGRLKREGRELLAWARHELLGLMFERRVRGRIQEAIKRAEEGARVETTVDDRGAEGIVEQAENRTSGDDDWGTGPSERVKPKTAARNRGIRFERGWDAGWIREALAEI